MKRSRVALVLGVGALLSCSDTTTNQVNQLNLDRPVDIAFACYGSLRITGGDAPLAEDPIIPTAQPIESCNIRSGSGPL